MKKHYNQHDTHDWLDFWDIVKDFTPDFIERFMYVDTRKLGPYLVNHQFPGENKIGTTSCTLQEKMVAMKLLSPTLNRCPYFFRTQGTGTHMGVDFIMPQGTPIESVSDGKVIRIKRRNKRKKDEGNCVVIKTLDNYFIGYEHLENISVEEGEHIGQGQIIGTCGTTGNSTQFHLHLQIDKASAPFHPYWTSDPTLIDKHTINPLTYLRKQNPSGPFSDIPNPGEYQSAILSLYKEHLIQGFERKIFPNKTLSRYEVALLIDRICKKKGFYDNLPIMYPTRTPYTDTQIDDDEFKKALHSLQKYGIMKGYKQKFMPHRELKGEELLALLGRIFYKLQDSSGRKRRTTYLTEFILKSIIPQKRPFIKKNLPRKEVFLIVWKMIK